MNGSTQFRISLRIWHPEVRSDDITKELGLLPKVSYNAGDRRTTPKGTELSGFRAESFWTHEWNVGGSFESAIDEVSARLLGNADFLCHLKDTGGRLEYFVGWFSTGSSGFMLDHGVLKLLSDLRMDLAFDVYAESQAL